MIKALHDLIKLGGMKMLIKNITIATDLPRKRIYFELENAQIAKNYEIGLLPFVRGFWRALDMYAKGSYLILDGPVADSNGNIIQKQDDALMDVVERIKYTIINDVPGFKNKIERIISSYQAVEHLDLGMVSVIDRSLSEKTKQRFMKDNDWWLYAKIIRKALEGGPYPSADAFESAVNSIFDDENLICSFMKEIDEWKKDNI